MNSQLQHAGRPLRHSFLARRGWVTPHQLQRVLQTHASGKLDPYGALGLSPCADEKEIKRAYRKMVLRTHPDQHADDPEAQERFIDVQEAYETLVRRAHGKEPTSDDWEFHDWFWNFSRQRKWRKPSAAQAAAAAPAQPGQLSQQLAGLKRKAAFRRSRQGAGDDAAPSTVVPADMPEQPEAASSNGEAPAQPHVVSPWPGQPGADADQEQLDQFADLQELRTRISQSVASSSPDLSAWQAAMVQELLQAPPWPDWAVADLALAASVGASLRPASLQRQPVRVSEPE